MKSRLWQLGRQLKLAKLARGNPSKSLKGLINPFKQAFSQAAPQAVRSSTRQSPRALHRPTFHALGQTIAIRSATRPAYGSFASRTPQVGLGSARTFATGRGAVDVLQNVNIFARCALNQLGEHKLHSLQGANLKRSKQAAEEERLQDFNSYFGVPAYKTVLVAPISASVSHLLTEKAPASDISASHTLFDEDFLRDLVKLKVSSTVHAKRLDVLCASIRDVTSSLEVTNTPGNNLLVVRASFDGSTPEQVAELVQERLAEHRLDDIGNPHLMKGWYRLYKVDEDIMLHDIVSQSFCLPDPAADSPLASSMETVALN